MGIIRSGVVLTLGSILFLTLFMGNIFLTLSWSLEYDNVQDKMEVISHKAVNIFGFNDIVLESQNAMLLYCDNNANFTYDMNNFSADVPCNIINAGIDNLTNYYAKEIVYDIYYKEYDCNFIDCLKEDNGFFVLVSEKAYDYWHSKFYLMVVLSIIIFVLMFVISSKKNSVFIISGVLTIISAIPFKKLDWVLKLIPDGDIEEIVLLFFTKSYNVFFIMLIIGIALLIIGVAFTFLGAGMIFSKFLDKLIPEKKKKEETPLESSLSSNKNYEKTFTREEVKEIVKEELKKSKRKASS